MISQEEVIRFFENCPTSKTEFEQECGLSPGTLSKVGRGKRNLNQQHLNRIFPVMKRYGYGASEGRTAEILSFINHKGGVGKTTTTLNLGKALAILGHRVLLIDLDPQGSLTQIAGLEEYEEQVYHTLKERTPLAIYPLSERLDLAPSDIQLAEIEHELTPLIGGYNRLNSALLPLKSKYEYILLDCPPALNIFTNSALCASSGCLVTMQPEASSIKGINSLFSRVAQIQEDVNHHLQIFGILITMVDLRTRIHKDNIAQLQQELEHFRIFSSYVRLNVAIKESQTMQQDIFTYDGQSAGATDYMRLAQEILPNSN